MACLATRELEWPPSCNTPMGARLSSYVYTNAPTPLNFAHSIPISGFQLLRTCVKTPVSNQYPGQKANRAAPYSFPCASPNNDHSHLFVSSLLFLSLPRSFASFRSAITLFWTRPVTLLLRIDFAPHSFSPYDLRSQKESSAHSAFSASQDSIF